MDGEHDGYLKFTGPSRLDKFVNSLIGIIEGIAIDASLNATETGLLKFWLEENDEFQGRHPFNELMPVVSVAIQDGVLTHEERQDILWLCEKLQSSRFYDSTTASMQRLHGILGGIAADAIIGAEELNGLSQWLSDHEHLRRLWPYDEVDSLVTAVLADRKIDEAEHRTLLSFFSEFIAVLDDRTITDPLVDADGMVVGLCAVCPEIVITGSTFCFTGASPRYSRDNFTATVSRLGGRAVTGVSKKVDYLVIGSEGNPCWAYSCYGRKVEAAVDLRRRGCRLAIVHEHDFHDAVADFGQ